MTQTKNTLALIFNLNDRLFHNALEGVTQEQADERISGHNNPPTWIAAHTVSTRYLALMVLGRPAQDPYQDLFENFKGYDPALKYPQVDNIKAEWDKVTSLLKQAMDGATGEQLNAEAPFKNPTGDFTNAGTLAFLAQHESYDIGQMAFLKKYHTKEAMKY